MNGDVVAREKCLRSRSASFHIVHMIFTFKSGDIHFVCFLSSFALFNCGSTKENEEEIVCPAKEVMMYVP